MHDPIADCFAEPATFQAVWDLILLRWLDAITEECPHCRDVSCPECVSL